MSGSQPLPSTSTGGATGASQTPSLTELDRHFKVHGRKPPHKLVCKGTSRSWSKEMSELDCPICFEIFNEPVMTICGHTFCNKCIRHSLSVDQVCPKCGEIADDLDDLIHNSTVNDLVARQFSSPKAPKTDFSDTSNKPIEPSSILQLLSGNNFSEVNLNDFETLIKRKKEVLKIKSQKNQRALLLEFLNRLLSVMKTAKEQINEKIHLIDQDVTLLTRSMLGVNETNEGSQSSVETMPLSGSSSSDMVGFNTQVTSAEIGQMNSHFRELINIYMNIRKIEIHDTLTTKKPVTVPTDGGDSLDFAALDDFGATLSSISRYSKLKPLVTFSFSADLLYTSNVVSSIEFDKDNEFLAIAGVPQKIKLFEYATVIGSSVDVHCPTAELNCSAKISCVSWNNYYKNRLASSDYDGCVSLWDASTAFKTRALNEHEKRVWSVDWSNSHPKLLASGSDDLKVKLWSLDSVPSLITLEAKSNVCCVKFCPQNSFVIAFGCADNCVYYYDFRQPRDPIGILRGHRKTVSYVKFASKDELVSASTDSYLKIWSRCVDSTETMECVKSFSGHTNWKHFTGLATDGNYIACGSEDNSLYVYDKHVSRPLFSLEYENHRSMLRHPINESSKAFVSAVAWKKDSPVIVASNSEGTIKFLEMI